MKIFSQLQIGGYSEKSMLDRNLFISSSSNYPQSQSDDWQIVKQWRENGEDGNIQPLWSVWDLSVISGSLLVEQQRSATTVCTMKSYLRSLFLIMKHQLEPQKLILLLMAHGCRPQLHSVLLPDSSSFSRSVSLLVRSEEDWPVRCADGPWGRPQQAEGSPL